MKAKNNNSFFTVLYRRQQISEEYVLFTPCHYIEGLLDPTDKSFMDNSGNVFVSCNNYDAIENNIDLTYYFDIATPDLLNRYQLYNSYEAIGLFYEEIRKVMLIGKVNPTTKVIDLFSISSEKLEELAKSPVYGIDNEEGYVTITKAQLEMLLGEKSKDAIKRKLSKFLLGTKSVQKVSLQKGKNVLVSTNTDGSKITRIELAQPKAKESDISTVAEKITAPELKDYVTSHLVGQDRVVEDIVSAFVSNFSITSSEERIIPFIVGPTGSGKSFLFKLIGNRVNRPVINVDCTNITQEGYHGKSVEDILRDLYYLCGKDKTKMEHAIVFLDEIDKKAARGNYVSDIGAQQNLLKFIEGGIFVVELDKTGLNTITVDTSNMLFAAGGAFEDLFAKKNKKLGFGSQEEYKRITRKDLIDYGMIAELIGRFNLFEMYDEVTVEMMKKQLTTGLSSPIVIKQKQYLRNYSITLEFSDSFYTALCSAAIEEKSGFRGLDTKINECLIKAQFRLQHGSSYSKLIITEETIDDPYVYQLIK